MIRTKRTLSLLLALLLAFSLGAAPAPAAAPVGTEAAVDVDLTKLSSTMVYSEVYNMMYETEQYLGKTVKMKGQLSVFESDSGRTYFTCLVQDATACCAQGLEFKLTEDYSYPEDYPEEWAEITVIGTVDTYEEVYNGNSYKYLVLRNARML